MGHQLQLEFVCLAGSAGFQQSFQREVLLERAIYGEIDSYDNDWTSIALVVNYLI